MVSIARHNPFYYKTRLAITPMEIMLAVVLMTAQIGAYPGFVSNASQIIDHTSADIWFMSKNV